MFFAHRHDGNCPACFGAVFAAVGFACLLGAPVGHGAGLQCKGIPVRVYAPLPSERISICQAATHVVKLLQSCGIEARSPLMIEVVQKMAGGEGQGAYGCFDRSTGSIQLLALDRCAEQLRTDESRRDLDAADYFQSVAAHEVAHGILAQQEAASELPLVAQEYLAYALQIDSLAPNTRQAFLKPLHDRGTLRVELPHEILLFMNPPAFGAIAYLHFKSSPDQCATIKSVLRGEVNFPRFDK
jgi:hypothetical protein